MSYMLFVRISNRAVQVGAPKSKLRLRMVELGHLGDEIGGKFACLQIK